MNSKERVLAAVRHEEPDRVPINIWLYQRGIGSEEVKAAVVAKYGSLDGFYDTFGIDLFTHILSFPYKNYISGPEGTMISGKGGIPVEQITDQHFQDPDGEHLYTGLKKLIDDRGGEKAIVAHVWGVLEASYGFMGIENALFNIAANPSKTAELYERIGNWSARVAENAIELGADIVQISADAGSTTGPLINPKHWWRLIYPNDKVIVDAIKRRGIPAAMHNDGNIWPLMDGIVEMGIDILHPVQSSAGMDPVRVKQLYGDRLTIHGGLDITYVLPRAPEEEMVATIARYMSQLKPQGGFIFHSEHFIPADVTLSRLELAYETALKHSWYKDRG